MVTLAKGATITCAPIPPVEALENFDKELDIINDLIAVIRAQTLIYANGIEADVHLHLQNSFDDTKWMMSLVLDEQRSEFAFATVHNILFNSQ